MSEDDDDDDELIRLSLSCNSSPAVVRRQQEVERAVQAGRREVMVKYVMVSTRVSASL